MCADVEYSMMLLQKLLETLFWAPEQFCVSRVFRRHISSSGCFVQKQDLSYHLTLRLQRKQLNPKQNYFISAPEAERMLIFIAHDYKSSQIPLVPQWGFLS